MPKKISGEGKTEQFSVRISPGLLQFIEEDVKGPYSIHGTRNEWLKAAAERYMEIRIDQMRGQGEMLIDQPEKRETSEKGRT